MSDIETTEEFSFSVTALFIVLILFCDVTIQANAQRIYIYKQTYVYLL